MDYGKKKKMAMGGMAMKDTYTKIDKLRRIIQPNTVMSRSQTINILVNEKVEKLNGRIKNV